MRRLRRVLGPVALAATVVLVAASCATDGSDGATTERSTSSASPAGRGTTTAPPVSVDALDSRTCAWPTVASKGTSNIAYPDTAATYWVTPFRLAAGQSLSVEGRFPDARYASFITYDPKGDPEAVLTDVDLDPIGGGANPFATDAPSGGRYASPLEASGTGSIIYRVYLGRPASDPTGGVGLPRIVVHEADGSSRSVGPCPRPTRSERAGRLVDRYGPATDKVAPPTPVFLRPAGDGANLYPNPDNTYVATILHHEPGRVAVIRGRAPTFPDTGAGQSVAGDHQVRYWSLCSNEYRKPYPVSACVADQDVALADDGTYTVVVSTTEDRPANATTADGVTWLPWGSTKVDVLLLLRQMLPATSFPQAAAKVPPGDLAVPTMRAYAPIGAYCTTAQFESYDPACG